MTNALPYLLSGLLGWVTGHISSLFDRYSSWLRLLNYPVGIAGAALGTMLSTSLHNFQSTFLLAGILCSACALLLFRLARRLFVREEESSKFERGYSL